MTAYPHAAMLLQPEILRMAVLATVLAILLIWQHFEPLRSDAREMNSNYSNILTLWDRLFGTATEQPAAGHSAMRIGLPGFRAPADQRLPDLLLQPFKSARGRTSR